MSPKIPFFAIFLLALLAAAFALASHSSRRLPSPPTLPSASTPAPASSFCGGIANIRCPAGFTCRLDGSYPDAGGRCVPFYSRPSPTCTPRPACLDAHPPCLMPETPDMCPPSVKYVCPATEWLNCMPGPDRPENTQCETDYLTWALANCPGFKGAAR